MPNKLIDTYRSLCTEFYDLDKPNAPEDALNYYLLEAKNCKAHVLEPMCGSGRFLIPMMEHGIDIEGTDASPEMLESCRSKCRGKNLSPVLYYQKIQELLLPRQYGLMFVPSGSFGLLTDTNDVKQSLGRIYDYLLPGGKLIIEIETPYSSAHNEIIKVREVSRDDTSKILLTTKTKYNNRTNIEIIECTYENLYSNTLVSAESEVISVRHYFANEFENLLRSSGFLEIEKLKPYTGEKAEEKDEMILSVCLKQN